MCRSYGKYVRACAATKRTGLKVPSDVAIWNPKHTHLLFGPLRSGRVMGSYRCGCSYGPIMVSDRLEYCATHGENIKNEYPVLMGVGQ